MLGTAVRVDVWLLLEYKASWKPKALQDNNLAPAVKAWLRDSVAAYAKIGLIARPQFIRRPELDVEHTTLFVAREGKLFCCEAQGYDAITALNLLQSPLQQIAQPQYFVCTNGQRDLCCARFGLPAYARLRELVGHRAWQTTHVGGHRFAPNVLALPQGALYGRVVPDSMAAFVAQVETGELATDYLRGRSVYPSQAQVAETRIESAARLERIDGNRVTFATASGEHTIEVNRSQEPLAILPSCAATKTDQVFPFEVPFEAPSETP